MKIKESLYNKRNVLLVVLCIALVASFLSVSFYGQKQFIDTEVEVHQYFNRKSDEVLYLSDIEYVKGSKESYVGYDQIRYNEVNGGGKITLKVEGSAFVFDQGIWAHAKSRVTYDISNYNYQYFTAFIGIDNSSNRGDGVRFSVFTSLDGTEWGEAKYQEVKLPGQEATYIAVELNGAKYLRLEGDPLANNAADHSVWADAKLTNTSKPSNAFLSIQEYDDMIKSLDNGQMDITGELEFNILKRRLVQQVGEFTLNSFYNSSDDNKIAIDWLMSNQKVLRYYILGGKPNGSYYNSLTELSRLYRNYKEDFENTEVTQYGTILGDLYLRMAISLSLTHSNLVGLWMSASTPENKSDSVRRYAIMKYMHRNELFTGANGVNYNNWFEDYTIEEMRYVMMNNIDDESILWLNAYTQELIDKEGGARLWPHRYIAYVWPNYANPIYYAEENEDYFNELFSVKKSDLNTGKEILDANGNPTGRIGMWDVVYTVPGGKDVPEYTLKVTKGTNDAKVYKVWMNLRNKFGTGCVCGGISKTGANIRGVHGLPDAVVGQPGHAAHINYFQNSNGEGFWGIDNDVSGWAYTGPGGRSLLGWGNAPYASGYSGTYIPLAQEVVNHNDTYEQSQKLVYLADSYSDLTKKEEIYRKALEIQPLNLDAWYGLILTYNESSNKTEEDYYGLAQEIAENLKYYPLPMYQMTNLIKPKLTSIGASYQFTLLQTRILKEASQIPNNSTNVLQPSLTKLMANFLLGQMDTSIATFSFDGEDAGKIVLSSRFDGNGVRWDYAIKGKGENNNWDVSDFKEVSFSALEEHKWQLTPEEIASITSENDLYIHIVGVNYAEENLYKIDIQESAGLPATLFASDLENELLGSVGAVEWKYQETDNWTRYETARPDLTGDKTIIVRMGATGTYLAEKTSTTYSFTEDAMNPQRKYIPVSHLSLESVSTEATNQAGSALFALDANYNTRWHSAWNGSDTERFITVKLDQPYNISAVEFVPAAGGNGKIYDGTVWGSLDGENWIILSQQKGLTYTNQANTVEQAIENIKSFDMDAPQRVQYVKIVADRTNGNWITARAFNFYEDTTIQVVANFSFTNDGGKLELVEDTYDKNWQYSLDNGASWTKVSEHSHILNKDEICKITSENGIKIKLGKEDTIYSIKIKEAEALELNPYINDLENRLIGVGDTSLLEWKYKDSDTWTSYQEKEPVVTGNQILEVRKKAIGITLPSAPLEFSFTDDFQPETMKYIPVKHLTVHSFISQSRDARRPHYAVNVIDANPTTQWHSDFAVSVAGKEAYITLKTDTPRYISGIDYVHLDSTKEPYGFMKNGQVYVSEDGENWVEVGRFNEVSQDDTVKHLSFTESVYGQYVKLVMESHDNVFVAASMINLYEDTTKKEVAEVNVSYDKTTPTNESVVATVEADREITILNNNGSREYTFDRNGSFTFQYTDESGECKEITAKVTWIDKDAPIGTIQYSTRDVTNEDVIATLTTNENVTITNNGGSNKYTFTETGNFTFHFVDAAGNRGEATAEVTWINKQAPTGKISYSTTLPTKGNVTATIELPDGVVVTNNNGRKEYLFTDNGEFTFEFVDRAGNRGTLTSVVNWIDRTPPRAAVSYSTTSPTKGNVTATLIGNEEITVTNNNGSKEYVFTDNGKFTFEFVDRAGNSNTFTAKVDWIKRTPPTADLEYSTTNPTNKNVTVTLKNLSSGTVVTNNNGKTEYTFEQNGAFVFELRDSLGNTNKVKAEVTWIDREAPVGTITYSESTLTNKDVVATITFEEEGVIVEKNTYTFKENGEYTFEFRDAAGNVGTSIAKVDWIDKIAPTAQIKYNITTPTVENVVATLVNESEEIIVINNNGSREYVFEQNGEFTFEFKDKAGNIGKSTAVVKNIKQSNVIPTITYSTKDPTNQNVTATITFNEENVRIDNNNGSNKYTFKENGTFTFVFFDAEGKKGIAKANVTWIDKEAPIATITYSDSQLTNKDVTATITFNEEDVFVEKNTYTFKENGEYTFEFRDKAGNKGTAVAKVSWIDKIAPTAEAKYSTTNPTNQNVIVTLINESEEIIVTNNNGSKEYTFEQNGEFTFEFKDKAGNIGKVIVSVNNITKKAPTGIISYSKTELTNEDVVASISFAEEGVSIKSKTHTFKENGEFTFEFTDKAGNKGTAVAKVSWIDKEAPIGTISYSNTGFTSQNVIATIQFNEENVTILNGGATHVFSENGEFTFEFRDKAGNMGSLKARVTWISKENQSNQSEKPNPSIKEETHPYYPSHNNSNVVIDTPPSKEKEESEEENLSYGLNGVKVILAKGSSSKDMKLVKSKFILPKKYQDIISEDSDCFELYFQNNSNERLNPKTEKIILTLDNISDSLKIFEVKDDTIKELEYNTLSNNEIEINVENLGKYIVSYHNEKKTSTETIENIKNEKDSILIYVLIVIALLLGFTSVVLYRKRK